MTSERDTNKIRELLSDDPPDAVLEQIATAVAGELADSLPELTLDSRSMAGVLDDFEDQKRGDISNESPYETKIEYLRTYLLKEQNLKMTDELSSRIVEKYEDWRKYESLDRKQPLTDVTLQDDMYLFREFIRYLIEHRLAPERFYHLIDIPEINPEKGEGIDEKKLDPGVAKAVRNGLV